MFKSTAISITGLIVCLGIFFAAPVSAQSSGGAVQPSAVSQSHQMMYGMMKDMSQEMSKMTEQMARGEPTPELKKQLAQRMNRMSTMMHRMAGLQDRPAMKEPEMQKQMEKMRTQMDDMMRDAPMKPAAK